MRLWRKVPSAELPPIIVHGAEVEAATREADAQACEAACDWRIGSHQVTHEQFHYGFPCPFEVCATILRGRPDPRLAR